MFHPFRVFHQRQSIYLDCSHAFCGYEKAKDIGLLFLNNKGPGILIYLKKLTPNHPFTDIKIQDCISKKNNFSINVQVPKGVNGKVIISNCDFSWFKLIRTPKTFMVEFNN